MTYSNLLHTPSTTAGMSPDMSWMCNLKLWNESSSRKRSTSWLRPDYHITIDKKYDDMTYSELVCGMTCVLNRIRHENHPAFHQMVIYRIFSMSLKKVSQELLVLKL